MINEGPAFRPYFLWLGSSQRGEPCRLCKPSEMCLGWQSAGDAHVLDMLATHLCQTAFSYTCHWRQASVIVIYWKCLHLFWSGWHLEIQSASELTNSHPDSHLTCIKCYPASDYSDLQNEQGHRQIPQSYDSLCKYSPRSFTNSRGPGHSCDWIGKWENSHLGTTG